MIAYDEFGGEVVGHLDYALDLSDNEAAAIFLWRLQDGTWRRHASAWVQRFCALVHRAAEGTTVLERVFSELAKQIIAGPVDPPVQQVLVQLLQLRRHGWNNETISFLADWFVSRAEPGDASLAADILEGVWYAKREVVPHLAPVAGWLIRHGAAELRARRRLGLALRLVGLIHQHARDLLLPAVRYVLENEERLQTPFLFDQSEPSNALLKAVDSLLADGTAKPELVADIAREFDADEAGDLLGRIAHDSELLAVQQAAFAVLARGHVDDATAIAAWSAIRQRRVHVPAEFRFENRDSAHQALVANARFETHQSPHDEDWARSIVTGLVEFGLRSEDIELLVSAVHQVDRAPFVRGVRRALKASGLASDLARRLLEEHDGAGAVSAALRFVNAQPPIATDAPSTAHLSRIKQLVDDLFQIGTTYPPARDLIRQCERMSFVDGFENEDKVRVVGRTLHVDRGAVIDLATAQLQDDELVMVSVIYVVHEFVHLLQQIGDKQAVTKLRATGAETTLMHVDLGADHAAAMVVAGSVRRWSVTALKDVTGRSLAAFPTKPHHTTAARARKAHRLIGVRLDYLARLLRLIDVNADEYAFAEFGPAGGQIVLMRSGPPWALLGIAPISPDDAEELHRAAGIGVRGIATIDAVLKRVVEFVLRARGVP